MPERLRVLLVEDSEVYREALLFLLARDERLEIVAAVGDGASALRAFSEHEPDVVVVDYRLPDLDGFEVATALRALRPTAAIVFLSASAGEDEYDAARRSGATLVRKDEGMGAVVDAIATEAGRADA